MDLQHTKIIETTRALLRTYGYFVDHLWHVDDVHFICEQHHIDRLSDTEAMEVFEVAIEQFDGECGMSWPQLEKAVHTYVHRKSVLENLSSQPLSCDSAPGA